MRTNCLYPLTNLNFPGGNNPTGSKILVQNNLIKGLIKNMGQNKANPTPSNWIKSGPSSEGGVCQNKKIIQWTVGTSLQSENFLEAILWTIEIMFMAYKLQRTK